ncbi:DUF2813 domain-containing protein [Corynebacterium canis]|uniref:DUF2813 domain-containing protein n=1 Tax=Corynebacterium canis TaxID=679663 RepID=A0A5C5URL5_9CORY|nr:AAA family ATPase [Corynebacterium canis]TWT28816.1 DUF2813 domain-containing protein [Corynebacterium canis]WJY74948.1 chromosome segregation protein [Corynebacterium canis]
MILHSIVIEHVRGIEHLELTDIPDAGVLVIFGENEAGKSTILDALHTVLNVRHTSMAKGIKALQPVGQDAGPRIRVEASVGPYRFSIDKTYLRKKSAALHIMSPNVERLTGAEADQRLEAILAEHLDRDLFEALLMRQGAVDAHVRAVGIPSLVAALDQGEREEAVDDSALMKRVDTEYARYFTVKTGAVTGELKAAEQQHAEAERAVTAARAELRELEHYVSRHAAATSQLEETRKRRPSAEAELQREELRHADAVAAQERIERARAALDTAQAELDLAESAVTARERINELLRQARARLAELQAGTEEFELEAERERVEKAKLTEALQRAREHATATAEALRKVQATVQACRDAASLRSAEELAKALEEAEEAVVQCRAGLPQRRVEQRDVERAEEAQLRLRTAEIERDAVAATLTLSAVEQTDVTVNGEQVTVTDDGTQFALSGETVFEVGGVTAVISAGREGEAANRAVARARQELEELLAQLGYSNVDAVRKAKREHDASFAALQDAKRNLRALQPRDETLTQLRARIARLREQEFGDLPTLEEAEAAVPQAEADSESAAAEVAKLRAELDGWAESKAWAELQVHRARVADAAAAVERAEMELKSAEESNPSSLLRANIDRAKERRTAAATALEQARSVDLDIKLAAQMLAGARELLKNLGEDELTAEKTLAELSGRITQATGAAERCERAEAAEQLASARLIAIRRRADAVSLLRDTLLRHREVAREKYAQPFVDALTHLAKPIFGNDVGFTLTEGLEIERREVKNIPLNIEALSGGAKEQLAILTRLAIAQLVSNDGVPIIIDDALGNSDSVRVSLMSTLFSELGRSRQVLILTCDQNRYLRVEGAKRYRMDELQR